MSTGGASLYPLAKYYTPMAISAGGQALPARLCEREERWTAISTISTSTARFAYASAASRFEFYTKNIDPQIRAKMVAGGAEGPRASRAPKTRMQFGAAALTEQGLRLWQSDFLPAADAKAGPFGVHASDVEPAIRQSN